MTQTLLFDFDGTIANTIPPLEKITSLFNIISDEIGFNKKVSKNHVERFREMGLREIVKELKIPFYKLPFIARKARTALKTDLEQSIPIEGVVDVLHALKNQGFSLSIITSSKKKDVEDFLQRNNLQFFDFVHSERNLFGKARVIQHFLKKHNLGKGDVVYIGDEIRDIDAAKKAEIKIVSVTWGFNSKVGLQKHMPDFLIDKPKELLEIFEKNS